MGLRRHKWQDRKQHLHWVATGDQLPRWTPDWFLNLWPDGVLNRIVCWRYGCTPEIEDGVLSCIWCRRYPLYLKHRRA